MQLDGAACRPAASLQTEAFLRLRGKGLMRVNDLGLGENCLSACEYWMEGVYYKIMDCFFSGSYCVRIYNLKI